jgi:hypothetical protein
MPDFITAVEQGDKKSGMLVPFTTSLNDSSRAYLSGMVFYMLQKVYL